MSEHASSSTVSGFATYRRLLSYVRPHRMVFALAIVGMIGASLTDVAFAALIKPLLDLSLIHISEPTRPY